MATCIWNPDEDGVPLQLPAQDPAACAGFDPNPTVIASRVADLPLADPGHSAELLLELLRPLNRTRLPAAQRRVVVRALRQPVAEVLSALSQRCARAALPLRGRDRHCAERVLTLAQEAAYAEKALLVRIVTSNGSGDTTGAGAYAEALAHSVAALGQLLLAHYQIYAPVPAGIWGELHSLYRQGERLCAAAGDRAAAYRACADLFRAYRRAVLTALVDPYHMMQGEVQEVDRVLADWVEATPLEPAPRGMTGRFFVALNGTAPPTFGIPGGEAVAGESRVLDVAPLLQRVGERITALAGRRGGGVRRTLAQRLERAMWLRVHRAWSARAARGSARVADPAPLRLALGLGACHHFLSGEAEFRPEWSETRIRSGGMAEASSRLTLVPKEVEPWRLQEEEDRLRRGIVRPRESHFDAEDAEKDVWEKVYAHPTDMDDKGRGFVSSLWKRADVGPGGLAAQGDPPVGTRVGVGQLVGFIDPDCAADGGGAGGLGVVRWLKAPLDGAIEMGIKRLANRAEPVATRGVVGAGRGTEYFRALGVPEPGSDGAMAGLIVPAGIYEVGTVLAVNLATRLFYVQLTCVQESTVAFAQFGYRLVPAPPEERDFLPEISRRRP